MRNMDDPQVVHFANEIDKLVDRFKDEYDLTYAAMIGVLFFKCHSLCDEASPSD